MLLRMTRAGLALSWLCLVLIGHPAAMAQQEDNSTAEQMLEQGYTQYQQGQYEAARQTLEKIDPMQLAGDDRTLLEETLAAVESQMAAQKDLEKARQAERDGNLDTARDIYRHIVSDRAAPRMVREQALAGLARIERAEATGSGAAPPEVPDEGADARTAPPADQPDDLLSRARKLEAQRAIELAREAENDRNYTVAAKHYRKALDLDPNNEAARTGLQNVKTVLAGRGGEEGLLGDQTTNLVLKRQRQLARYEDAVQNAGDALDRGALSEARDHAALAKSIIETNRNLFDAARYRELRRKAVDLATRVGEVEQQQQRDQAAAEQDPEQGAESRQQAMAERQQRIAELLEQAQDLTRQGDYELALEQIEQVLFLDSDHAAGQFMKTLLEDQMIHREYQKHADRRDREIMKQRVANLESTIPYSDLVTYPPDWPELTERRLDSVSEETDSEANRATRERLQQTIPVDFQANQLENVIEFLRNVTGANFFVQWRALENAGVTRDTPITMQLSNVPAEQALRLILEEAGGDMVNLGFTVDEGVVVIATQDFLAEQTVLSTYDIRDLIVQVPTFDQAPEFDLEEITSAEGAREGGGGGDSIFGDAEDDEDSGQTRTARIQDIMDLIRNSVDPDNWRATGGLTSSMSELNGTLIVTTTARNHQRVSQLLRRLREQRALQIAVESRFLFVTQNFLEEVGIDVDLSYDTSDEDDILGNVDLQNDTVPEGGNAQDTGQGGQLFDQPPSLGLGTVGADGALGSVGFILDDLQVDLMVRASRNDVRNITLNTPRVTFFNGQRAYVAIATQTAFVSDLDPIVASSAVAFDPEISVVSSGIVLDVEGTISADRRYVTMTLRPSLAQLVSLEEFSVSAASDEDDDDGGGGGDTGAQFFEGRIQQPIIQLTTVRTTVSVPDKGTLLIGGQRLVGEVEVERGVPVLSRVPVLNRLFTNRATTRDETTLLILVKPQIIVQSEEEERLFPGLAEEAGLYNLGNQSSGSGR